MNLSAKLSGHSESSLSYTLKNLAATLLLFEFALRACAQTPALPCPTHSFWERELPSVPRVISELDAATSKMRASPETADIKVALRSAETFQRNWLQDRKGRLEGVGTLREGLEDVLLARWDQQTEGRQIKNIQMWDAPLYELVIFEIEPSAIASEDSLRRFLLTLLKPPPEKLRMKGPTLTPQALHDGFDFFRKGSGTERWSGSILRMPHHQLRGFDEEYFTVQEIAGRVFLVFDFGKRFAYAPWPQSIYLSERFPPLATRVQAWTKEQLLREITSPEPQEECWDVNVMGQRRSYPRLPRDQVLVAEMVRRGLDPSEFQAVMDSPYGRELLLRQLQIAGQTEHYVPSILETIHRYENSADVNRRIMPKTKAVPVWSHLADVIRALIWQREPDFSATMLELAAAGHEADLALEYLHQHMTSSGLKLDDPNIQELAAKLATAKVPPGSEDKRDFIVRWIRSKHAN